MKRKRSEAGQDFPRFLKHVRKEENVLLEQLSKGLMTVSNLARIEKGQRPASKNIRDCLLGRLGIANELYENMLNIEDHATWERQCCILCAIESQETKKAQELILDYETQKLIKDGVQQQFCLMMKAEVLKQQQADFGMIGVCYEAAAKCTIPDIAQISYEKRVLSIQEVNVVLEYEYSHKEMDFEKKCKALLTFVEQATYDALSKVKVYPKIVYYYLREVYVESNVPVAKTVVITYLQICDRAVEMLRDTGRAYYLLELLEIKLKLLEGISTQLENGEQALKASRQECRDFAELLKSLCAEYHVPMYMQDSTYLYRQRWMFYVGDILCIRRNMYGLTQKKLCEGICSVRTLRRTEKKEANMQQEVLGKLLRRLGISKEFQRARLVANDREVLKLREEIAVCRNNREPKKARALLEQMRERVSMDIPENKQYFLETEASLDWMEGKITKKEFAAREEEALRCTLKVKKLYNLKEVYLTEMEMLCIRKRIQGIEGREKEKCIDFLLSFLEWYEKKSTLSDCISMYEFVIVCLVSELGNMGEYELSKNLGKKALRESLMQKRIWIIADCLYNIMWNENEQREHIGQPLNKKIMTETLQQCILLSHFCRQTLDEKFYYDKSIYQE